jgi:hypothetical protein
MPLALIGLVLFTTTATATSPHVRRPITTPPVSRDGLGPQVYERQPTQQASPGVAPSRGAKAQPPAKSQSPRAITPAEPAPPPDLLPSEAAPAGAGFAVPTIGEVYIPEIPIDSEIPLVAPTQAIEQHEAQAEDSALTIDDTWQGGDAGLKSLCGLPGITSLTIKNARLTDAALDYIAAIPNLKILTIQSTPFSAAALAKLQRQRPIEVIVAGRSTTNVRSVSRQR